MAKFTVTVTFSMDIHAEHSEAAEERVRGHINKAMHWPDNAPYVVTVFPFVEYNPMADI